MCKKCFLGTSAFFKNMSWIFIGNIAHAVLSFLINIIVARSLTTSDNGVLNYAASWITFYNALASLGINGVINKFTTEDNKESNKYLSTAILFRIFSAVIGCILVIATVGVLNTGEKLILYISALQSLSILFSCGDTLVFWFRYKKEARQVAIFRLIAFLVSAMFRIIAIVWLQNLFLYVSAILLETLIFSIILIYDYRKRYSKNADFSISRIKIILKFSYPFMVSATVSAIYAQTDRVMLKHMLGNDSVAYYSIAVTLAGLMSVIVQAIIEGFRPEIISYKISGNNELYKRRLSQVYGIVFWICILYVCFISLFSEPILFYTYGEKYLPSQSVLSVVVCQTVFSYFGLINSIFMVAENQGKWIQVTTLIGAVTNVVLNYILIPLWGINGAAVASLITQVLANFIAPLFIPKLRPIMTYIVIGITLRTVLSKDLITKMRQLVKK